MRKQPRSKASLSMLTFAATLLAAGSMLIPDSALAHGPHRARRSLAPPTAASFEKLRSCESRGNYSAVNRTNKYFGAYQFSVRTWRSLGYGGMPHQAPPAVQDQAAKRLQARSGWRPWPGCARKMGLR